VFHAEARLRALMLASLGGNAAAYRDLLKELSVYLRSYYRRRLPQSGADAEDLVQETLIAVDARRASYDASQPFTPWVFAIARYRFVDHLRRARVRATTSLDGLEDLFGTEDHEQVATEMDVERMLSMLPAKQSDAIRMTRIEGHSIDEVAQLTGQSQSAIKVGIHRGLKRLRAFLTKDGQHEDN
jgi:RNA polymerase sigma-70 factor, ECF subfamily